MQNFINNQTVFKNNGLVYRLGSERSNVTNKHTFTFTAPGTASSTGFDGFNSKTGFGLAAKRAFDITVASIMLLMLAPLLLLIALLIKLTSKGPVIFQQQRPGKDLQPFTMLKFRTMAASNEYEKEESLRMKNGSFCKTANDVRITPIGRFLRKCSLDELPQLVNVLRGDMSLVGPRPILNCELETFSWAIQKRRFSVRPGLTCIWQVSGRSNTDDQKRLKYDLEYVKNWSLLLDFKLLLKTIPVVIKCQGAM
jgi:lipopolysaccharide/colanic/teichoic acid biosynthesis glycosyltransferase